MTFIWLLVWIIQGTPKVDAWNSWLIGLIVCLAIDLLGSRIFTRKE